MLQDYRVLQGLSVEDVDGNIIRWTSYNGTPEGNVTAGPGSICADISAGKVYQKATGIGNTGWVDISGNVTYTASGGVKLVVSDFQADLDAAGGLELNTNSIRVNVDSTNNTTEINASNEVAVKGFAHKSVTLTAGPDTIDSIAISGCSNVQWNVVIKNGTTGRYSMQINALNLGTGTTTVDYSKSGKLNLGTIVKPVIDVDIDSGNMRLLITGTVGYIVEVTRISNI